jgi:hypothetical protein
MNDLTGLHMVIRYLNGPFPRDWAIDMSHVLNSLILLSSDIPGSPRGGGESQLEVYAGQNRCQNQIPYMSYHEREN